MPSPTLFRLQKTELIDSEQSTYINLSFNRGKHAKSSSSMPTSVIGVCGNKRTFINVIMMSSITYIGRLFESWVA